MIGYIHAAQMLCVPIILKVSNMTKRRKLIPLVIFTLVLMYGVSSPAYAQETEHPFFSG